MDRALVLALLLALSRLALADVNGTVVLQGNSRLNFDNGTVSASDGDMLWNGTTMAPQTGAGAASYIKGYSNFTASSKSDLQSFNTTSATIQANKLTQGFTFIVATRGGNLAKAYVEDNTSGVITLIFTTFGATPAANIPVVYQVLNNSSGTPPLYPNYGVAPSSIIAITGSGLSDPGGPVLQSSAAGLKTALNGTTVNVTVNNVTVNPALYYTSPGQLAAVLPAATPAGNGVITVTYRGVTSAPSPILVLASDVGINTYGPDTAVATDNGTGAVITTTNSAAPNQVLVLWTTGLGADPADSDSTFTSTPHAIATPLQIYVGSIAAQILYQGSSGYPGVDQIDIVVPPNAPTGCWVSVIAVSGGIVSNATSMPIRAGGGVCVDSVTGLNGNQVSPIANVKLKTGLVDLEQVISAKNGTSTSTNGAFETYTGLYSPGQYLSPGGCYVGPQIAGTFGSLSGLSVGNITLTGPNNLSVALGPQAGIKGAFNTILSNSAIPATGGTFTFTATGGSDVASFTATVTFSNPVFVAGPLPSPVDRSQGFTATWTGGNPGGYVYVLGTSTSQPAGLTVGFTCMATVDARQFTVPAYVLSGIPAGTGGVNVQTGAYSTFAAQGLDTGLALGGISYQTGSNTFQ